jgi:hypothetical protein
MPKDHEAVAWCAWQLWRSPATAKLHNAALLSVSASQSQAPLVAATASRPSGESNRRYAKLPTLERSHSRRRFPVACTPYAPPSARPCGCRGTWASVRRCALCGWSVACGQSCGVCPRPPLCFAATRHQPCALVCPSAPRGGSLSPRASVIGFCYMFGSWSRTEYGVYRPNGLYASVAAGIFFRCNGGCTRYGFDSCLRTFYGG